MLDSQSPNQEQGSSCWRWVSRVIMLGVVGLATSGCAVYESDYPQYRYYGGHRVLIQSGPPILHAHLYHTSWSHRPARVRSNHRRYYRPPVASPYVHTHVRRGHRSHPAPVYRRKHRPAAVPARPGRPMANRPYRATPQAIPKRPDTHNARSRPQRASRSSPQRASRPSQGRSHHRSSGRGHRGR